jgi:hypothetical protein
VNLTKRWSKMGYHNKYQWNPKDHLDILHKPILK